MPLLTLALALVPALLLVRYYYRQDRARPEPKGLVVKVFLIGVLSALVAIPLEFLASQFQRAFDPRSILFPLFKAFVVAGLVEEYLKLTVVRLTAWRNPAFDEVMDGIVYTVVAGMGFACLENVLYVMGVGGSVVTALARAFTAVPMHAVSSGLMGYSLGRSRFAGSPGAARALVARGLLTAVGFHGLYDFLLFVSPMWGHWTGLLVVPLVGLGFLALRGRIRVALAEDQARVQAAAAAAAASSAGSAGDAGTAGDADSAGTAEGSDGAAT
jgi:RsiW-degrading membrane proteinase PrsW (M82 family)